jgi:hypothetical protein
LRLPTTRSWARRAYDKSEELRDLFSLPPDEHFISEFMCALKKRVLLQGRLYVFRRHLGFFCSLFGYQKQNLIPLDRVTAVHKRRNVGFPNSIEVHWSDSATGQQRKSFFTSFLSRQEAYRLILALWAESCEAGRIHAEALHAADPASAPSADDGRVPCKSVKALLRGIGRRTFLSEGPMIGGTLSEGDESVFADRQFTEMDADEEMDEVAEMRPPMATPTAPMAIAETGHVSREGEVSQSQEEAEEWMDGRGSRPVSPVAPSAEAAALDAEFDAATEPPTPPSADMRVVGVGFFFLLSFLLRLVSVKFNRCRLFWTNQISSHQPSPPMPSHPYNPREQEHHFHSITPRDFWRLFLSTSSRFFHEFHALQGHRSIALSPWQRHSRVGTVRDLRFITPVASRMGPPEALCHQTQRYRACAGERLVFESSQVVPDIPYGEHFSVEARWDMEPAAGGGCVLTARVRVPFSKVGLT